MKPVDSAQLDPIALELPYKGNRQYLHGTDIFNAVVALTKPRHAVSFRFHRVMRHPIELVPVDILAKVGRDSAGCYVLSELDETRKIWLFRDAPARKVTRRVPYDEADVVADAAHRVDGIESPGPSPYSFIERSVALNKAMLMKRGDTAGGWLFTQLDLTRVPAEPRSIELRLTGFLGTKMAKSAIVCDGDPIGHMTFWSVRE